MAGESDLESGLFMFLNKYYYCHKMLGEVIYMYLDLNQCLRNFRAISHCLDGRRLNP